MRILVVDDNPATIEFLCGLFDAAGAKADCVTVAEDALSLLSDPGKRFDVLISDIRLGGQDVLWLIEKVRALPGEASATPAVAFTAEANFNFVSDLLRAGFDTVIPKPADRDQLVEGIVKVARPRRP